MTTTSGETRDPRPTALVGAGVEALHARFYEPLAVPDLLREAWEGATAALGAAGIAPVPPAPAYPADPTAAYAVHADTFPALEDLAAGRVSPTDLAAAALRELLARRRDGHTLLFTPHMLWRRRAPDDTPKTFGLILTDTPPLAVADVLPRGPAQRAGVRRGQVVLAINGQPAVSLRRFEASYLLDWRDGGLNRLTLRDSAGEMTVELRADPYPPPPHLLTEVLPGPIGYLRRDGFDGTAEETDALRGALTSFEQAGARGWVIDVRWCGGGVSIGLSRLLVGRGRLFSRQRRDDLRLPDGETHPRREDIDADGTALPFQRPLVILVGPGSISGAESFAGPLQALGRATLVGERTAGVCGFGSYVELAPDWAMLVAARETVFGPEERRFNRIGVPPDVVVTPRPDDEAAGRDPQLEVALRVLRDPATRR